MTKTRFSPQHILFLLLSLSLICLYHTRACAEFLITSAIIEFNKDSPAQQDIEVVSKSADNDYVVSEVSEMINPGQKNESRRLIDDPVDSALMVTPDKMILTGGSRKVLRFVLLKPLDQQEHIYRVTVKPVIKGVENSGKVGLKILVGYEVLVIVRPADIKPSYNASRHDKTIEITNSGNSNVLFQTGQQCNGPDNCKNLPTARIYPGQMENMTLPSDLPAHYSVWDGVKTEEKTY